MTNREKLSKMTIFGSDWTFFAQKRVKKEQTYFSQNFNQVTILKYHKYSFIMKQQQKPMS